MFDVFISYKHSDDRGGVTIDYECARELEKTLTSKGVNVFFSEHSLVEEGRTNFKRAIDEALDEVKVLLVIASNAEYTDSPWVRYEWESFYNDYLSKKRDRPNLFTVLKGDVDIQNLPRTLRNLQCFDFDTEMNRIVETVLSILNIKNKNGEIEKNTMEELNKVVSTYPYYLIKPEEITDDDIKEVLAMEAEIYKEDECQDFDLCQKIHRINPYTDLFFKDLRTGKIVANIDICPITDECYELFKSGEFMDSEITPEMVVAYDMPALYNLYFTGIAIKEEYRNTSLLLLMISEAVNTLIKLGDRGILFKRMIADAVTPNGERFCKIFGMKNILNTEHGSKIYEVVFMPPEFHVESTQTKQLYNYYKKKYDELFGE